MKHKNARLMQILVVMVVVGIGLFVAVSPAYGLNSFLKGWEDHYTASTSSDSDCALCHGSSTSNLNTYGKDLCEAFGGSIPSDIGFYLASIESLDSDLDGTSNITEINANSQPGWTEGLNQLYTLDCAPAGSPITVPAGVPLPYDPLVAGDPIAVPGGPYTGNVNVPVVFDGSGSYDSDGGDLASYTWDFGDGSTETGMSVSHTYTVANTYTVSLTVVDDEGTSSTNSTTATISSAGVLDLDITSLTVTNSVRVGSAVSVKLSVNNPGKVLGQAIATVKGVQNSVEVYSWRLNVYDTNKKSSTTFTFPSYTPTATGNITWTATIADKDPDLDLKTATTVVK